jgi:hypothetical protein
LNSYRAMNACQGLSVVMYGLVMAQASWWARLPTKSPTIVWKNHYLVNYNYEPEQAAVSSSMHDSKRKAILDPLSQRLSGPFYFKINCGILRF